MVKGQRIAFELYDTAGKKTVKRIVMTPNLMLYLWTRPRNAPKWPREVEIGVYQFTPMDGTEYIGAVGGNIVLREVIIRETISP